MKSALASIIILLMAVGLAWIKLPEHVADFFSNIRSKLSQSSLPSPLSNSSNPTGVSTNVLSQVTPKACDEQYSLERAKDCTFVVMTDQGHGSGFAISDKYLVTNKHVLQNAHRIDTLVDGQEVELKLWDYSQEVDLAVLTLSQAYRDLKLSKCDWSNSHSIELAETLFAVGWPNSPDGDSSITRGIFSRFIQTKQGPIFIQTDAAINPGNSGGPLVNQCGIVGVNTSKVSWSEGNIPAEGFSFAIASNYAQKEVSHLIETGKIQELPIDDLDKTKYSPRKIESQNEKNQAQSTQIVIPEEVKQNWRKAKEVTLEMKGYWLSTSIELNKQKLEKLKDLIARMEAVIEVVLPKIESSNPLNKDEQDLLKQWSEMYNDAIKLEGQLHNKDYSQGYYHYKCQSHSCVPVKGRGVDRCYLNSQCN